MVVNEQTYCSVFCHNQCILRGQAAEERKRLGIHAVIQDVQNAYDDLQSTLNDERDEHERPGEITLWGGEDDISDELAQITTHINKLEADLKASNDRFDAYVARQHRPKRQCQK